MLVDIKNTSKKLCVIGDPVMHSKSPLIQNAMIRALGLDYVYLCQPVRRGEGAQWLTAARVCGYAGFNATMPFKEELLPLMDQVEPFAERCGAVNTVCIRDGKYYGYNTDGPGFLRDLEKFGLSLQGLQVVVLGAGGASKAVCLALIEKGAQVTVCNRTVEKAEELCKLAPGSMTPAEFTINKLCKLSEGAELVVNCTSLGMEGAAGEFEDLSFVDALPRGAAVYDLIYAPAETALLRRAGERGLAASNGLGMLVWQAVLALEHFTGAALDGKRAHAAALEALGGV